MTLHLTQNTRSLTVTHGDKTLSITRQAPKTLTFARTVIAASASVVSVPAIIKIGFDQTLSQIIIEGVEMFPPQSLTVLRFGDRISVWQVQVQRAVLSRIDYQRITRLDGTLFTSASDAEFDLMAEFELGHPDYLSSVKAILNDAEH